MLILINTPELHRQQTLLHWLLDLSGVRWWSTPTHEHQLLRTPSTSYHVTTACTSQSLVQKNDTGCHLATLAIALLRYRVSY